MKKMTYAFYIKLICIALPLLYFGRSAVAALPQSGPGETLEESQCGGVVEKSFDHFKVTFSPDKSSDQLEVFLIEIPIKETRIDPSIMKRVWVYYDARCKRQKYVIESQRKSSPEVSDKRPPGGSDAESASESTQEDDALKSLLLIIYGSMRLQGL